MDEITLSSGAVFRLKQPSLWAIYEVERQLDAQEPGVPQVWLEDKERWEENPGEPAYLAAMEKYGTERGLRMYEAFIGQGTELVSVPEGMGRPEDDDWVESLGVLGISVPDTRMGRYIAWVKYVAAPAIGDWGALTRPVMRLMGTPEAEVQQRLASFQGLAAGEADNGGAPEAPDTNGSKVRKPRPRTRRAV